MKCFLCEKEFPNRQSLGGHISAAHPEHRRKGNKRRKFLFIMETPAYYCQRCNFASASCPTCPICANLMDLRNLRRVEEIV